MIFILSSISNSLEFRSINLTSICENSESNVFKSTEFSEEIFHIFLNGLLGTNVNKTLEFCRKLLLAI